MKKYLTRFAKVSFVITAVSILIYAVSISSYKVADVINNTVSSAVRFLLSSVTSLLPFSSFELLVILSPIILILTIALAVKRVNSRSDMIRGVFTLFAVISLMFTSYIFTLGVGYHTTALAEKIDIEESADLRKKVENFMQERAMMLRDSLLQRAEEIGDIKVIRHISNENPETNKIIVPFFRGKFADVKFMYVAGNVFEGKPSLSIFLSQPMVDAGFNAGKLIREAAKFIQGGGGGQAFMATAGGKNPEGMDEAINYVIEAIK